MNFFLASCVECFDRVENVVEGCNNFAKSVINCELNTTLKECEETKNALIKYCSSKQCQGDFFTCPKHSFLEESLILGLGRYVLSIFLAIWAWKCS